MSYQTTIDVHINVTNGQKRVKDATLSTIYSPPLYLFYGTQVLFRAYLYNDDTTPFVVPTGSTFAWAMDSDLNHATTPIVQASNSSFNDTNDWSEADPQDGRICWRVDLDDAELGSVISGEDLLPCYSTLWMIESGSPSVLWNEGRIKIENVVELVYDEEQSSMSSSTSSSSSFDSSSSSGV